MAKGHMKPPDKNVIVLAIAGALIIWWSRRVNAIADNDASFIDNFGV